VFNKEKKFKDIPSEEKALLVADWLYEKQGEDIVIMDVAGISSVTDMTIVVSARGVKHAKALAESLLDRTAEDNIEFLSIEGQKTGEWVLVDLNDVLSTSSWQSFVNSTISKVCGPRLAGSNSRTNVWRT